MQSLEHPKIELLQCIGHTHVLREGLGHEGASFNEAAVTGHPLLRLGGRESCLPEAGIAFEQDHDSSR